MTVYPMTLSCIEINMLKRAGQAVRYILIDPQPEKINGAMIWKGVNWGEVLALACMQKIGDKLISNAFESVSITDVRVEKVGSEQWFWVFEFSNENTNPHN